jgi:hypothetical protein
MTITSVACDKCRQPIGVDRVRLTQDCGPAVPTWATDPATLRPTLDLCPSCIETLAEWLKAASGRTCGL